MRVLVDEVRGCVVGGVFCPWREERCRISRGAGGGGGWSCSCARVYQGKTDIEAEAEVIAGRSSSDCEYSSTLPLSGSRMAARSRGQKSGVKTRYYCGSLASRRVYRVECEKRVGVVLSATMPSHAMACRFLRFQTSVGSSQREGEEANHTFKTRGGEPMFLPRYPDATCTSTIPLLGKDCKSLPLLSVPGHTHGVWVLDGSSRARLSGWAKGELRIQLHFAAGKMGGGKWMPPFWAIMASPGREGRGIQPHARCHFCGQPSWGMLAAFFRDSPVV